MPLIIRVTLNPDYFATNICLLSTSFLHVSRSNLFIVRLPFGVHSTSSSNSIPISPAYARIVAFVGPRKQISGCQYISHRAPSASHTRDTWYQRPPRRYRTIAQCVETFSAVEAVS